MKTKIKILETIRQGQIGGGESHVLDLVTHLDKDEFTPVVLSFTDGPMVEKLRESGRSVEYCAFPMLDLKIKNYWKR